MFNSSRVLSVGLAAVAGVFVSLSGFAQTQTQRPCLTNPPIEGSPSTYALTPGSQKGTSQSAISSDAAARPSDVAGWVRRLRSAAQRENYTGTLIVMSDAGRVAGSRVWHACRGDLQIERVDLLDGPARTVFRRDAQTRTFFHTSRTVLEASASASSFFPKLPAGSSDQLDAFYRVQLKGVTRVAGHDADEVWLVARDGLRFGYRIWSERRSGLVLRVQTVQQDGRVLEQASFLQVDLTTPVSFERLSTAMDDVSGYDVLPVARLQGEPVSGGWRLHSAVPGFALQGCRVPSRRVNTVQCNYADGLASVSVFVESLDAGAAPQALSAWSAGATSAMAKPLDARTWLTVVGEVPSATLSLFAERLERVEP